MEESPRHASAPSEVAPPRLVYELEDRLPAPLLLLAGLQHVLAMFVGVITPPLIVAGALGLGVAESAFLVSAALLTSGLTTLVQVHRLGPVGSGLLSVQGTSFTFVPISIQTAGSGLGFVFGMALAALPLQLALASLIGHLRRFLPPLVTGTVVLLIGLSLVGFGLTDLAGGVGAPNFGHGSNYAVGLLVIATVVLAFRFGDRRWAPYSILLAGVLGYGVAGALGMADLSAVGAEPWLRLPRLFRYGLDVDLTLLVPWLVAYAVTTMETLGDLTATSEVSGQPISGPLYERRLRGGLFADALGSGLAACVGALPNTTFSQNNGVIAVTGIAARRVGYVVAATLALFGLSPKVAALLAAMPKPVLGGLSLPLFGLVAAAGVSILGREPLGARERLILALSLGLGVGVMLAPEAISRAAFVPAPLQPLLQSGFAVGGVSALVLNLLLPPPPDRPV